MNKGSHKPTENMGHARVLGVSFSVLFALFIHSSSGKLDKQVYMSLMRRALWFMLLVQC